MRVFLHMWLLDIEDISQGDKRKILSPLSLEEINKIGELKQEAIIGFVTGEHLCKESFRPNQLFVDFMQNIIKNKAPQDYSIQNAALQQKEGWLYIIDCRAINTLQKETCPEDIIGAFEVRNGQINSDSYQPNRNYSILSTNGLLQLPSPLDTLLFEALRSGIMFKNTSE